MNEFFKPEDFKDIRGFSDLIDIAKTANAKFNKLVERNLIIILKRDEAMEEARKLIEQFRGIALEHDWCREEIDAKEWLNKYGSESGPEPGSERKVEE